MSKLNRILWSGLVLGIAACGDNVTVTQPPEPTPGIRSVTVAPDGATIVVGGSLQMTAAVTTDPGADAPTIAWSSSDPAKATVGASTGIVNALLPGAVGIRATATSGTSTGSGVATVNVVAAPTCSINGVSVSPDAADLVVGQTLAIAANVSGSNACTAAQLGVTYRSSSTAVATVSTAGLVTAQGAGSATITALSVTDTTKRAAMSLSVTIPTPASVSIQSITQGNTNTPVQLNNVAGQVEVTLNVDPGSAPSITKAQILIGGVVVAEQCYAAACGASPAQVSALAPQLAIYTLVLSTNTRQVRKLGNGLYVPVVFNGPNAFSAKVFTGAPPASSNAVPVVMQNSDAIVKGPTSIAANQTTPSWPNDNPVAGTIWYRGNVDFGGGNYIAFFPVTPANFEWWSWACGLSNNAISGTPTTGLTFAGQFDCAGVEDDVEVSGWFSVTPGTAPAADVIYHAVDGSCFVEVSSFPATKGAKAAARPALADGPSGCYEQTGTAFSVNGDTQRYNLLDGGSFSSPGHVFIDNVAPSIDEWDPIGYLNGCEVAAVEGCWVNGAYQFASDLDPQDFGSGVASENFFDGWTGTGPYACGSRAVVGGNDYADNLTKNVYTVCATLADNLGNVSEAFPGPNPFSVDKIAPSFEYAGNYDPTTTTGPNEGVFGAVPAATTIDYKVIDENSGIDQNVGVVQAFSYLVNDGTLVGNSTTACTAPGVGLTAPAGAGVPRQLATPFAPDAGCDAAGYYYYTAHGEDRAGNQSGAVSTQFGMDRATPVIDAINLQPLYGGGMVVNATVFASEITAAPTDGADLSNSNMGIGYVSNGGTAFDVVFPPAFFPVFGAPWDASLYLRTPAVGATFTLPGSYALGALIDAPGTGTGGTGFTRLVHIVRNVFGTPSATATTAIPGVFTDPTKLAPALTNTVWTAAQAAKVQAPDFAVIGSNCAMTYGTPTNGPVILSRVWLVDAAASPTLNVLEEFSGTPALISDNGTTREYRVTFAAATCPATGQLIAVANDVDAIPHGYLFTPTP